MTLFIYKHLAMDLIRWKQLFMKYKNLMIDLCLNKSIIFV